MIRSQISICLFVERTNGLPPEAQMFLAAGRYLDEQAVGVRLRLMIGPWKCMMIISFYIYNSLILDI